MRERKRGTEIEAIRLTERKKTREIRKIKGEKGRGKERA